MTAAASGVIAAATLFPSRTIPFRDLPGPLCVFCGDLGLVDFLSNLVLFMPLGVGLRLLGLSTVVAAGIGFGLSLTIEILQATMLAGRHPSLGDTIANSAGALCGSSLAHHAAAFLTPSRRLATGLVAAAAIALPLPSIAGSLLLHPAPSPTTMWWGQWEHDFPGMDPFPGTVLAFQVNRQPVPEGPLADTERLRQALSQPPVHVEARVLAGGPVLLRAQVAAIADGTGGWTAAIWQEGAGVQFDIRLRTGEARIRTPALRLPQALAVARGTPVRLWMEFGERHLVAEASSAEGRHTARLPLFPSLVLQMLVPLEALFWAPPMIMAFGAVTLWVSILGTLGLIGAGALPRSRLIISSLMGLLALALSLAPRIAGLAPEPVAVWAGAITGWAAAAMVRAAIRRA